MSARTATVSEPPRTGLPLPTPGLDPDDVVGDPLELDEQAASAAGAAAPSATAPPVAAVRDRKVRRSISLRPFTCSPLTFGCSVWSLRSGAVRTTSDDSFTAASSSGGTLPPSMPRVHGLGHVSLAPPRAAAWLPCEPWTHLPPGPPRWRRPTRSVRPVRRRAPHRSRRAERPGRHVRIAGRGAPCRAVRNRAHPRRRWPIPRGGPSARGRSACSWSPPG